jgi:hypothetical protein
MGRHRDEENGRKFKYKIEQREMKENKDKQR